MNYDSKGFTFRSGPPKQTTKQEEWDWKYISKNYKTMKRCSCEYHEGNRHLPKNENFHKDPYASSGYYSWCKDCYNRHNNDKKWERYKKEKIEAWRKNVLLKWSCTKFNEFLKIQNPSEKDYRNYIGAYYLHKHGLQMEKEVPINGSCRPDLKNFDYKFHIEVKLTDKLSTGSGLGESCEDQKDRYVDNLPDDWTVFLVSLDGSIGLNFYELEVEIEKLIKK